MGIESIEEHEDEQFMSPVQPRSSKMTPPYLPRAVKDKNYDHSDLSGVDSSDSLSAEEEAAAKQIDINAAFFSGAGLPGIEEYEGSP